MNSSHSRWVWAGEMCLCIWSALLPALIISAAGWPFDVVICKMSGLVQGASVSASVFTLVAIAVERLITLTRPHFTQDYKHNLQEETLSYTDTICTSAVHAKPAHLILLGTISLKFWSRKDSKTYSNLKKNIDSVSLYAGFVWKRTTDESVLKES